MLKPSVSALSLGRHGHRRGFWSSSETGVEKSVKPKLITLTWGTKYQMKGVQRNAIDKAKGKRKKGGKKEEIVRPVT